VIWLAIEREPTPAETLWEDLARPPSQRDLLEATRALRRSTLVEAALPHDDASGALRLALQSVVMDYVTDRLVQSMRQEIANGEVDWLHRFAVVKAHSPEHVQESQRRLLLEPLARGSVDTWGRSNTIDRLRSLVARLQQEAARAPGYAGANLLHLLLHLDADVKDLRTASLVDVDFHDADLKGTTFADTFGAVTSVSVSPDGRSLAIGGSDGHVFVWQMNDYQPRLALAGHTHAIGSLAWSPDGARLASGGFDGQVRLWDGQTGQLAMPPQINQETIAAVAWTPDSSTLASGGAGKSILVADSRTGEVFRELPQQAWIYDLAFSPDGQILAAGNGAGEVQLWNWRTGDLLRMLRGHEDKVRAVAFSPDGALLASAGEDGRICLWRIADPGAPRVLAGHRGWVLSLAWRPDGRRLASASADHTVRIWDPETERIETTLLGHTSWASAVAYSLDGATVVSGGYDQSVRLWDASTGRLVHRLHGTMRWVSSVRFSPDGRLLAGASLAGPVHLWDVGSGRRLRILRGHHGAIRAVAFGSQGRLLAGGCDDHQVYLWESASGELRRVLRGHIGMVRSVAFSPDGSMLVTGSFDRTVRLWNPATGQLLGIVADTNALSEFALTWSVDGELLAYPCADNTIEILHQPSGRVAARLSVADELPLVTAFSAQGPLLACGTREGAIWVWDVSPVSAGGSAALSFRVQPGNQLYRLLWSPEGRWLAAYDEGDTIHLIDPARGQVATSVSGVPTAFSLAFTKGGDSLITGDAARQVIIRDAATGEVRSRLRGHSGEITSVDASAVEDLVASSSADGVVRLWNPQTGQCVATLEPEGPYAGMNIAGATGITATQQATLLALGAVRSQL
jgi:WD40 repeat protein